MSPSTQRCIATNERILVKTNCRQNAYLTGIARQINEFSHGIDPDKYIFQQTINLLWSTVSYLAVRFLEIVKVFLY